MARRRQKKELRPRRMRRTPRPERDRSRKPIAPKGPRIYHRGSDPIIESPFMHPPEGFKTAHTSATEWMVYYALTLLTGLPKNPFKPPFIGGPPKWVYQKSEEGGRVPGGSVSDFVVTNINGTAQYNIRVETERYHIWTTAAQQQKDIMISSHLKTPNKVIRLYDQYFIDDPSGAKVCRAVALALRGIEMANPIAYGIAQRIRP